MTVVAVMTSMPSMRVRSVPVMRNNPLRKSNRGLLPLFYLSHPCASPPAVGHPGCDPLSAGDTARAGDHTLLSAAGRTHSHPAPASAGTANLVASCLPDSEHITFQMKCEVSRNVELVRQASVDCGFLGSRTTRPIYFPCTDNWVFP